MKEQKDEMKSRRIKRVVRYDFPETNSSSSHSCVIDFGKIDEQKRLQKIKEGLDIREGVLYLPDTNLQFGWNFFITNRLIDKIMYLCSTVFCGKYKRVTDCEGNLINLYDLDRKLIHRFIRNLCDILKVKDIKFKFFEDFKKYCEEHPELVEKAKAGCRRDIYESVDELYSNLTIPETDLSTSRYIYDLVNEDKEVLRRFLLGEDSYLLGGNDNSAIPTRLKDKTEENTKDVIVIARIKVGGELGDIDFEIKLDSSILLNSNPRYFNGLFEGMLDDNLYRYLKYDTNTGNVVISSNMYCSVDNLIVDKDIVFNEATGKFYLAFFHRIIDQPQKLHYIRKVEKDAEDDIQYSFIDSINEYKPEEIVKLYEIELTCDTYKFSI